MQLQKKTFNTTTESYEIPIIKPSVWQQCREFKKNKTNNKKGGTIICPPFLLFIVTILLEILKLNVITTNSSLFNAP